MIKFEIPIFNISMYRSYKKEAPTQKGCCIRVVCKCCENIFRLEKMSPRMPSSHFRHVLFIFPVKNFRRWAPLNRQIPISIFVYAIYIILPSFVEYLKFLKKVPEVCRLRRIALPNLYNCVVWRDFFGWVVKALKTV